MARVVENVGQAQVSPDVRAPDDYSHVQASPASFGGAIAQGTEQLGEGAYKASQFYGQAAADNAANDFQDFSSKLLYGDPSKTVTGPDGTSQPDLGYLGTRGRATLDQRPDVEKALDDKIKEIRSTLQSPEQQLQFDNFSRRYRTIMTEKVGAHADGQANVWYGDVNRSTANLALSHIANNADNPTEVARGASDLTGAYVKDAQLRGGGPELVNQAVANARRDGLEAQLNAIAVHDPARAMRILEKNREIAGLKYDNLAASYRARADQQDGIAAGEKALKDTYIKAPPTGFQNAQYDQIGQKYGISGAYLNRTRQIESGNDPNSVSPTGASGPFQFTGSTARDYGLKNPFDFQESADAAARLAADNKVKLTQSMGRPPTDAELYLAHQQGADGAAKLLAHPDMRAGDLVGDKAIRVNGGDPNKPASAFTNMWTTRFNGVTAEQMVNRKSAAFQAIMEDPNLTPAARQRALTYVSQQISAQTIAEEATAKAKKDASDKAMNGFVARLLTNQGTGNIVNEIANNPDLEPGVKWSLGQAAEHHMGSDIESAPQTYGPGFWNAYKQVTAAPGDPSRLADPNALLQRAGPGGDLTLSGVEKLLQVMGQGQKSVADASVNTAKTGLLNYAKGKLSFEADTGPIKIRDPKGEAIFSGQFIPKFEAAYDKWVKDGKDPWQFLTQENVDKLLTGMRSPADMARERLTALGEGVPEAVPSAPEGADEAGWKSLMTSPPTNASGAAWPLANWAAALSDLRKDPSPEKMAAFDRYFARTGLTAQNVLKKLGPTAGK